MIKVSKNDFTTILEIIEYLLGKEPRIMAEYLYEKGEITDEQLSTEINTRLNDVRKELYKLIDIDIASFRETENAETRWKYYHWTLTLNDTSIMQSLIEERIDKLSDNLSYEDDHTFFSCPDEHERIQYQNALMINFECPDCGEILRKVENEDEKAELGDEISILKSYLLFLQKLN
ncbi:MAG: hypothetical protein INQ03_01060 [Candidatus Heimdallarchaeota archaeon]|nr:hypothetical protein [Candidatus Heimdallarchaeota archaeon]